MAKKYLGQHWLTDPVALEAIAEAAEIKNTDTVLEIGPGLGTLTRYLVGQAQHVIAVELDEDLALKLPGKVDAQNLQVVRDDILKFDLLNLPASYKVVANIPYYLTSNLLRKLSESPNPPSRMVLLVQKEVAQRICAAQGQMSVLAVSVQLYYSCRPGIEVPAAMFSPPPKVDSQVVILSRHEKPIFKTLDTKKFFQVVRAGFSEKRKKLRSSLAGGLGISKEQADNLLKLSGVDGELRAQSLSLKDWYDIYLNFSD